MELIYGFILSFKAISNFLQNISVYLVKVTLHKNNGGHDYLLLSQENALSCDQAVSGEI